MTLTDTALEHNEERDKKWLYLYVEELEKRTDPSVRHQAILAANKKAK